MKTPEPDAPSESAWSRARHAVSASTRVWLLGALLPLATIAWTTSSGRIAGGVPTAVLELALVTLVAVSVVRVLLRETHVMTTRCLIVGTSGAARQAIDVIRRHPDSGLRVVGLVHCGSGQEPAGTSVDDHPIVGTDERLAELVERYRIDKLIVSDPREIEATLWRRLRSLRYRGVGLADYVALHEDLAREISVEHIDEKWLCAASLHSSRVYIRWFKRCFDVVAATIGLLLAIPIAAVVAVLVRLESPGPVLYRQERLGRDGVPFMMWKFRTMIVGAEDVSGPVWAAVADPRITRVGRRLRKFRIDELPQLVNVLRGEMSLVGPRPEREAFIERLAERIPFYGERLMVRPGITGWAQVVLPYAASTDESKCKLQADLFYIKHVSLMTDLRIMLKTLQVVVLGHERSTPAGAGGRTSEQHARNRPVSLDGPLTNRTGHAGDGRPTAVASRRAAPRPRQGRYQAWLRRQDMGWHGSRLLRRDLLPRR